MFGVLPHTSLVLKAGPGVPKGAGVCFFRLARAELIRLIALTSIASEAAADVMRRHLAATACRCRTVPGTYQLRGTGRAKTRVSDQLGTFDQMGVRDQPVTTYGPAVMKMHPIETPNRCHPQSSARLNGNKHPKPNSHTLGVDRPPFRESRFISQIPHAMIALTPTPAAVVRPAVDAAPAYFEGHAAGCAWLVSRTFGKPTPRPLCPYRTRQTREERKDWLRGFEDGLMQQLP